MYDALFISVVGRGVGGGAALYHTQTHTHTRAGACTSSYDGNMEGDRDHQHV